MKISKKIIVILLLSFIPTLLMGQYLFEWQDYYGANSETQLTSVVETDKHNLVLVGTARGDVDAIWILKTTSWGKKIWSKAYSGYYYMQPKKIIETYDKNYVVVSDINQVDSLTHKISIMKISIDGSVIWEKRYNGRNFAEANDVIETFDKGLLISGNTRELKDDFDDWYVLKVDSLGNKLWDRSFGTRHQDEALSAAQLFDSTLIVGGYFSYSSGGYVIASYNKFTRTGDDLWFKEFRGDYWSKITSVVATHDSAFVVTLKKKLEKNVIRNYINFDVNVKKMSHDGELIWEQTMEDNLWEQPVNIISTFDDGYAIAYTSKKHGVNNTNVGVMKLNSFGVVEWKNVYEKESDDYAMQVIETRDNGLLVGVSTYAIDQSWNYGVLKYKNLIKSDLFFVKPIDPHLTIAQKDISIKSFVKSYKKPQKVRIYINQKLVKVVTDFPLILDKPHCFALNLDLRLKNGLNVIDFEVTDYKDYTFVKTRKIYTLPNAIPHW